ncbi:homocysteine methyltransferase, partial [Streptomyces rubellomurinus subsp. indigoferus]
GGAGGAELAGGAGCRGRYGRGGAGLAACPGPRLGVRVAARPDVLALGTVPDVDEARALLGVLRGSEVPAWRSYSVVGDRTRGGQPLAEAFALAAEVDEVLAVGVNCCT